MIPRTVLMAQEVASQFTSTQLANYGNIILNGYQSSVPNTINKKAWQYQETTTAPVNLPSLVQIQPALKGWTTNYMQYYTQLPPNAYNQVPGNPTMFEYVVHSFTPLQAPILSLAGFLNNGSGYTPGTYTAVATTTSGAGAGATVDVVVSSVSGAVTSVAILNAGSGYATSTTLTDNPTNTITGIGSGLKLDVTTTALGVISGVTVSAGYPGVGYAVNDIVGVIGGNGQIVITGVGTDGIVTSMTLVAAGTDYAVGDTIAPVLPGNGGSVQVTAVDLANLSSGGAPQWAQTPRRRFQNQVSATTPPQYINNPEAIQYSFMFPVADNPVPPPIDEL